eukprot:Pgem_evm1s8440
MGFSKYGVAMDEENFTFWKEQFLAMAEEKGCEKVFNGDDSEYQAVSSEAKAKALRLLKLSMNRNTMNIVLNLDAREGFKALLEKYERTTRSTRIQIKKELYEIKCEDAVREFDDHINKVNLLCSKYVLAGGTKISDEDLIALLCISVNDQVFDSIITLIENDESISYRDAVSKIRDFISRKNGTGRDTEKVLLAKGNCHNCGRKGHQAADYWSCKNCKKWPDKCKCKNGGEFASQKEERAYFCRAKVL